MTDRQWTGKTDGTPWMLRSLVWLLKRFDVRLLYAVMSVVVIFYIIFRPSGTKAQYLLFRHRLKWSFLRSCIGVYKNHYMFGQVILDRFASYAGREYKIVTDGMEIMEQWMGDEDGFVVISSHVGNHEMAGYSVRRHSKPMYALAFRGEKQMVTDYRRQMFKAANINLFTLNDDMSHVFLIHDALSKGAVVTLFGDRIFGSEKTITAKVLGADAFLPAGPFAVSVAERKKVLMMFVMKERWNTYHIICKPLVNSLQEDSGNKKQKMQELADNYANTLADIVSQYPPQWFHYYNFWQAE